MSDAMQKWKRVSPALQADIQAAFKKHGVSMDPWRAGIFPDGRVELKITVGIPGVDPGQAAFKTACQYTGLKEEWFGQTFRTYQGEYRINGFHPKKFKRPVSALSLRDGKSYVFPVEAIVNAMNQKGA